MKIGQIVQTEHGLGKVVDIETCYRAKWDATRVRTGRLGVFLFSAELTVNPAYFWPDELQPTGE